MSSSSAPQNYQRIRQHQADGIPPAASPPPAHQQIAIQVDRLGMRYGDKVALRDVTLPIVRLGITAIIGPTGSGKSTFLRCLNRGHDEVSGAHVSGAIWFHGKDVNRADTNVAELRRRVGLLFQPSTPFPWSIFDNVAYGPRLAGAHDRRQLQQIVQQSLERASLWPDVRQRLDQTAQRLSGAQQQRLCIARALATEPEVLLMDEPAMSLDPASTARIEDLMDELKHDYTIVMITQNLQQASRASDYTAFFWDGELVESGPTTELFTRPKNDKTEAFITGRFAAV